MRKPRAWPGNENPFRSAASTPRRRPGAAQALAGGGKDRVGHRGTMAEVPASPIPPGGSELGTMWTSMAGASFMRSI